MHWMLMPLRRYADFSGRSRRMEYWMFFLGVMILYSVLITMLVVSGGMAFAGGEEAASMTALAGMGLFGIVLVFIWLGLLIPSLAVGVRRLHDIDRSGWWLMLGYGPWLLSTTAASLSMSLNLILNIAAMLGWIVLLIFAFFEGTNGPNRFGDDPKRPGHAEVFA